MKDLKGMIYMLRGWYRMKNKLIRYLNHLDKEALIQAVLFLMCDGGKDTIEKQADEFDTMYTIGEW